MKKSLLLLILSSLTAYPCFAATEISLSVSGEEEIVRSVERPLLILVTVSDRSQANQRMRAAQDERLLSAYKATAEYAELSPEERSKVEAQYTSAAPDPGPALGAPGQDLASLIRFKAMTDKGEAVELRVRPLKGSSAVKGPYRPGISGMAAMHFGIEATDLAAYADKDLRIEASTEPGLRSNTLSLRLVRADGKLTDDQVRALLREQGTYHVLDRDWDAVERVASELVTRYPRSADGWTLKGDALLGRGDRAAARAAYIQAVELAQQSLPQDDKKGPAEAPMYLIRKINELSD